MKNCTTCALAKDQGSTFACGFNPSKLLAMLPFYPVFYAKVTMTAVKKDKVPGRDCPAWKARKP